jgi:stage II sporulation protein D
MRLFLALIALVPVLASAAAAQGDEPPAPGEALFVVSGRGWGHGVGMSQYGAYGQANAGRRYDQILAYYYTGTGLGEASRSEVRVLLAEAVREVTIVSPVPFTILDGAGAVHRVAKGALTLKADLTIPFESGPAPATPPLVIRPGKSAPLAVDGRRYRGKLEVGVKSAFLRIVNTLPLESYLQGVVAGEMPHTWPIEALKAQAVAARSYALANLVKGKPFDLYADYRSQVYGGIAAETPRSSEAVRATAREIVVYGGKVATTYYFSTSGGKTASAADVFGFSVPYLVSKPDPWDKASPYHRWGPVLIGARTMQAKLSVEARILDAVGVTTSSGRLRSLSLETLAGPTTVPAALLRTGLGLRSTWVTIGVLRLDRPRATVLHGSTLRLSGIARGVDAPVLSSSPDGATWTSIGPARGAGGVVSLVVKPVRSLRYRLEATGAASPAVLVRVAPRVKLAVGAEPGTLTGSVRPRLPGAAVTIERREAGAWLAVADAIVAPGGAFRVGLALVPGSYRARVAPTEGYAEGVAPTITVSG